MATTDQDAIDDAFERGRAAGHRKGYTLGFEQGIETARHALAQLSVSPFHDQPIEQLDFTVRTYNSLKRNGYHTVEDLAKANRTVLRKIHNLGDKSLEEIIGKLGAIGIVLLD